MQTYFIILISLVLCGCTPIRITADRSSTEDEAISRWRCHPSGGLGCFDDLGDVTMISAEEGWLGNHLYYSRRAGDDEPSWQRLPQSEMPAFKNLDMVSPTEGWAGTKLGTIRLLKTGDGQWQYEVMDEMGYFSDIDMVSSTAGWAVGAASIERYYDNQWHREQILPGVDFNSIAMVSPTEGWIGVEDNLQPFYYYDGQSWQQHDNSYLKNPDALDYVGPIHDLAVIDANHVWAAGSRGILHYHDRQWQFQYRGDGFPGFVSIDMVSLDEGWAVGRSGMVHYQQGQWQPIELPVDTALSSVDMVDETEGWAVGFLHGELFHYYDNQWHLVSQNELSKFPSSNFYDIAWLEEADTGWIVGTIGWDGAIIRYEDKTWQTVTQLPDQRLHALDMVTPEQGWAVGSGGIVQYAEGSWQVVETMEQDIELVDVDMWDEQTGLAVGHNWDREENRGELWQYQQSRWQPLEPMREDLRAVAMVSPDEAWAVGNAGLVLHYRAGQWSDESFIEAASSNDYFTDIQMLSPTRGWLIGTLGLFRYQEGQWQKVDSPTPFSAMFMLSDNEGWFAGARQFENHHYVESYLWHYHNGKWTQVEKPLHQHQVWAIHMLNEHAGWAVGDSILQYTDAP